MNIDTLYIKKYVIGEVLIVPSANNKDSLAESIVYWKQFRHLIYFLIAILFIYLLKYWSWVV